MCQASGTDETVNVMTGLWDAHFESTVHSSWSTAKDIVDDDTDELAMLHCFENVLHTKLSYQTMPEVADSEVLDEDDQLKLNMIKNSCQRKVLDSIEDTVIIASNEFEVVQSTNAQRVEQSVEQRVEPPVVPVVEPAEGTFTKKRICEVFFLCLNDFRTGLYKGDVNTFPRTSPLASPRSQQCMELFGTNHPNDDASGELTLSLGKFIRLEEGIMRIMYLRNYELFLIYLAVITKCLVRHSPFNVMSYRISFMSFPQA